MQEEGVVDFERASSSTLTMERTIEGAREEESGKDHRRCERKRIIDVDIEYLDVGEGQGP